ncbi:MAG: phenylacetate-CoA oxygenase subunit PaaC [Anaerolineales bacterium]|nr:MAG: phenylacetate-CoA oxygenase subunit PaaC [Anaerolineales bacterium]
MDIATKNNLFELILALADDELILGHRDSEWCGHAPILEEDIAFANLALDEIGHANLWYALLADLEGEHSQRYADQLVFWREAQDYRNTQLVELPNGDWAFSILRHYLFDSAEIERLNALAECSHPLVSETAAKIRTEELYHLRHTTAWMRRLALGTVISHQRLQAALNQLWPFTGQLFHLSAVPEGLDELGIQIDSARTNWESQVIPFLADCQLRLPDSPVLMQNRQQHSHHLSVLLSEMQSVARLDPRAGW